MQQQTDKPTTPETYILGDSNYQYFIVTAPNTVFSQYLKQIKYQMLVLVHPQSEGNMRLRWGFLATFYKYMIQQIFYCTNIFTAPLRLHLRSSEFYKEPK